MRLEKALEIIIKNKNHMQPLLMVAKKYNIGLTGWKACPKNQLERKRIGYRYVIMEYDFDMSLGILGYNRRDKQFYFQHIWMLSEGDRYLSGLTKKELREIKRGL